MGGFEEFIGVNPWTALFQLINTIAVFLVAKKFLFVPVKKMIDDRQKEIDDMYHDADEAKQRSRALEAEYAQKISEAQATGDRIVQEAVIRGQSREEEIVRQAKQDAAAIREKAEADVAMEKKKAINDAKDEISGMAMAIASKVVERELTEADHARLISDFIDELGEEA